METQEPWAAKPRDQRNIGDFTRWKDPDVYRKGFDRILRDLKNVIGLERARGWMGVHKPLRGEVTRATISALVVLAFVSRLMLAAIPMPSAMSAPVLPSATLVPICTAEGLKWLLRDAQHPSTPAKGGIDCPLCALCMAAHGLQAVLPAAAAPIPVAITHAGSAVFHRSAPVLRIAARPPPSRGPPLPVGV